MPGQCRVLSTSLIFRPSVILGSMKQLTKDLRKLLKASDVSESPKVLESHSKDASIFEITPDVVVFPKSSRDIQKLVKYVTEKKKAGEHISITGRSAGTCMSGGAINDSVILSFTKHFNKIKKVAKTHVVVQPGVYYRDLEKQMDKLGVMYPSYPASKDLSALGGIVSNNAGGEKSLVFGKTEHHIHELKVVLSDGNEYTFGRLTSDQLKKKMKLKGLEGAVYKKMYALVSQNHKAIQAARPDINKNSAGYYLWNIWDKENDIFDLTRLFVGSQGTLGMITEMKLRVVPKAKHSKLLVMFLKDLGQIAEITNEVLQHKPESFESYDDQTLKLAIKFLPEMLKSMGAYNMVDMGMQFIPEALMVLTGGMPKLVMLAEFTGATEEEVDDKMDQAYRAVKKFKIKMRKTRTEEESEKYWSIRRRSFALLRNHVRGMRTAPFIDDFAVRPKYLPKFLPQLQRILKKYEKYMQYTIAGHVGDGNFHIIPLMDFNDARARAIIPELSKKVYELVLKYDGTIDAEHNDGLVRTPYLKQMYGAKVYDLFKQTKEIFDPLNIFNPGKKVGTKVSDMKKYMVKSS